MGIKALDGRSNVPSFPRIGKLHKGAEKKQNAPGKNLDHWRFTAELLEESVMKIWNEIYPGQQKSVTVILPYPTMAESFEYYVETRSSGRVLERGDGEMCFMWWNEKTKAYDFTPKQQTIQKETKWTGILKVIIPEFLQGGVFGIVWMKTTSKHDIISLRDRLMAYENMSRQKGGDLTGIYYQLVRVKRKTTSPSGKVYPQWGVDLIIDDVWMRQFLALQQQNAYGHLPRGNHAQLMIDSGTGEIVDSDFDDFVDHDNLVDDSQIPTIHDNVNELGQKLYGDKWEETAVTFAQHATKNTRAKKGKIDLLSESQAKWVFDKLTDRNDVIVDSADHKQAVTEHLAKFMPEWVAEVAPLFEDWTMAIGELTKFEERPTDEQIAEMVSDLF